MFITCRVQIGSTTYQCSTDMYKNFHTNILTYKYCKQDKLMCEISSCCSAILADRRNAWIIPKRSNWFFICQHASKPVGSHKIQLLRSKDASLILKCCTEIKVIAISAHSFCLFLTTNNMLRSVVVFLPYSKHVVHQNPHKCALAKVLLPLNDKPNPDL